MLSFKQFLTENLLLEGKDNLIGAIGGEGKGIGHVRNYIMPFLSKSSRSKTHQHLSKHGNVGSIDSHGEHYDPKAKHTHELHTAVGEHPAGTKVKVTHVSSSGNNLFAHTESHGVIPVSKLRKPEALKKPAKVEGFNVEGRIAANLGTKAAGSTKHGYDYQYSTVRGKYKEVAPKVRGESKLDKGKMGQTALKHAPGKGWYFTNEDIGNHFTAAKVKGEDGRTRTLLGHLNKFHPDGKINRNYKIEAPTGATRNYLRSGGKRINSLHIHHKDENYGTTFTVGKNNKLRGRTRLGHLTDKQLDELDGHIHIERTSNGSTTAIHRPKVAKMKEYAQLSRKDPEKHRDLTDPKHAKEFIGHVDSIK